MNFAEALKVKAEAVERPPLAPKGHYIFKVTKRSFDTIGNGKWDVVDFQLQGQEAKEDVDLDELSKFGGLKSVNLRHRFMFPKEESDEAQAQFKRTLFNLRRFLTEHLGLSAEGELRELIDQSIGNQCIANVQWRADQNDPEVFYAEIGRTAPVA